MRVLLFCAGKDMAYRKVRAGHGGPLHSQDLESEELQATGLELEWDMEKELEEPGLDTFQLEDTEHHPSGNSTRAADLDMEPIQPSTSPHGRFERLQEDPDYVSHFNRPAPKNQRRSGCPLARYLLVGSGLFVLGLIIGRYAHSTNKQTSGPPADTNLYQNILQDITAEKIRAHLRALNAVSTESEEFSRARYLLHQWTELGLTDVHLANYSVLLSHAGSSPSTITDKDSGQCFLPNGRACDARSWSPTSKDQLFSFAAYSAVGTLEAEVVDVQYGTVKDLTEASAATNATERIALLKLGQAPLVYTLSLLAEAGFGGVLPYVDPCDLPNEQRLWDEAFGITLNPGGDPSTPGYPSIAGSYREQRPNLTSLLVQPISASLAKELLSVPSVGQESPCTPLAMPATSVKKTITLSIGTQATYKMVHNVIGYLKGATNPDRYVLVGSRHDSWHGGSSAEWSSGAAVMTQIIASLTAQARKGWQPDRTTVFCSWGGSAFGNIGSFEWGEENRVVLQSNAVAYVSLHSPVKGKLALRSVASPSLLQVASDIHKKLLNCTRGRNCPGPNVSSVQSPGDVNFFANHLTVPTVEFAFQETKAGEKTSFLSEAIFPTNSSAIENLDPSFNFHEIAAKMTGEAILRLATDPVLPFYPLDIALDVQNKLKDDKLSTNGLLAAAASLRESSTFFQSEMMRPANDPEEQDPPHVRMLNDVLRDLERNFIVPRPPPGLYRNLLYSLNAQAAQFAILKDAQEVQSRDSVNVSLSLVLNAINSAERLIRSGLDLFENDPNRTN
ncbi:hypothetical protein MATL_G00031280 [Megalops atlanticus]|uniref:Transferrin receptor-like dimerisation domain-containing protein n=1 Tax=Megalops atlanticus TaxID=7932 RepID=A0A9D3QCR3_MEGAT|nr:hypothetical protein MATL_G00031280 [Megalops atlanticus]